MEAMGVEPLAVRGARGMQFVQRGEKVGNVDREWARWKWDGPRA